MTGAVEVSGLVQRYGRRVVFDGFDLTVAPGETLALLGASGCGKSTLLRCLAGLTPPVAGRLEIGGEIGVVFQEPRLMPWLSVERNVALAARDDAERARVREAIELVGLSGAARALPKELSGGMAQRAALARSLVRNPTVLLLDEPLSALDALLRIELQTAIAAIIRETGCTALLVTHDVDEALYLADRAIVLTGAPAATTLELTVPAHARRSRFADVSSERIALLQALGVDAARTGQRRSNAMQPSFTTARGAR